MAKKTKREIQLEKTAKKMANKHANGKRALLALNAGRMSASCIVGGVTTKSFSGDTMQYYQEVAGELAGELPWNGLTPVLQRRFDACAEAALWLYLKSRNKNPKHFAITAYNEKGHVAAPCANCALWVEKAFGSVIKTTARYEGRVKQRPPRFV